MIVLLTCTNDDCDSIPVEFEDPSDLVICGSCHSEITQKEPVE